MLCLETQHHGKPVSFSMMFLSFTVVSPKKLLSVGLKQGSESAQESAHFRAHLALLAMLLSEPVAAMAGPGRGDGRATGTGPCKEFTGSIHTT